MNFTYQPLVVGRQELGPRANDNNNDRRPIQTLALTIPICAAAQPGL